MRLGSLVSAGIGLVCLVAVSGCGTTVQPRAQVVGSPECPREQAVVRRALARSHVRVDDSDPAPALSSRAPDGPLDGGGRGLGG